MAPKGPQTKILNLLRILPVPFIEQAPHDIQ